MVIPTKFNDFHGWANCVDRFVQVVKQTNIMLIVPGGAIVGPVHFVLKNSTLDGIDSVWLGNNHVVFNT